MKIEKFTSVDRIEVIGIGHVQVRTKTVISEDGVEISSTFHRHVIAPGNDYTGEDERVQAICAVTHTAEIIEAYKAATAAKGI